MSVCTGVRKNIPSDVDAGVAPMSECADTVSSGSLGKIHRTVGHLDQLFLVLCASRISGDTDACGNLSDLVNRRRGDCLAQTLGYRNRVFPIALRKYHDKLFPAV